MLCRIFDWEGKDPTFRAEREITTNYIREHSESFKDRLEDVHNGDLLIDIVIDGQAYSPTLDSDGNVVIRWLDFSFSLPFPKEEMFPNVSKMCDWLDIINV